MTIDHLAPAATQTRARAEMRSFIGGIKLQIDRINMHGGQGHPPSRMPGPKLAVARARDDGDGQVAHATTWTPTDGLIRPRRRPNPRLPRTIRSASMACLSIAEAAAPTASHSVTSPSAVTDRPRVAASSNTSSAPVRHP